MGSKNSIMCEDSGDTRKGQELVQKERDEQEEVIKVAKAVGVAVAIGVIGWGLSRMLSGCNGEKKKMKAPGRDFYIYREDFEADPATYFRSLRD